MSNDLSVSVPTYRRHRATGQAVVTLDGRDFYLGKFGSAASRKEYRRLTGEWLASGGASPVVELSELTIAEMLSRYRRFAQQHYRPRPGCRTNELANMKHAVKPLREIYGHTLVKDFGPLALKALQQQLIQQQLSRRSINSRINRIRRVFRWAVSEELANASLAHALETVPGLRYGRSEARETPPIQPVSDAVVEATLPQLPAVVADMVRIQRLTGCRPAEVCTVRPCDVNIDGEDWEYRPATHKTQHHGHERVIFLGPQAQDLLRPYLLREKTAYCFSPADSERKRRAQLHAARKTPLSCGNRPGTNLRRKPRRRPRDRYDTASYLRAVYRACDRAFPAQDELDGEQRTAWHREHRWHPNQLRHSRATELRRQFGLEGAQVVLGHKKADVSQIYAERDLDRAKRIMREVG